MSLRVDSTKIYIENSAGVTKFDSSERLVFKAGTKTGSKTISATQLGVQFSHGLTFDPDEYFYNLYITITACSGNAVTDLINVRLPASNQLLVSLDTVVSSYWAAAYSVVLSAAISPTELIFTYGQHTVEGVFTQTEYLPPGVSISFDYELYLFRYSA